MKLFQLLVYLPFNIDISYPSCKKEAPLLPFLEMDENDLTLNLPEASITDHAVLHPPDELR